MAVHTKIIQIKINCETQTLNATVKKKKLGISVKKVLKFQYRDFCIRIKSAHF